MCITHAQLAHAGTGTRITHMHAGTAHVANTCKTFDVKHLTGTHPSLCPTADMNTPQSCQTADMAGNETQRQSRQVVQGASAQCCCQPFGGHGSLNLAIRIALVNLLKVFKFMKKVLEAQVQATKCASGPNVLFTSRFCEEWIMPDVCHQMVTNRSCQTSNISEQGISGIHTRILISMVSDVSTCAMPRTLFFSTPGLALGIAIYQPLRSVAANSSFVDRKADLCSCFRFRQTPFKCPTRSTIVCSFVLGTLMSPCCTLTVLQAGVDQQDMPKDVFTMILKLIRFVMPIIDEVFPTSQTPG